MTLSAQITLPFVALFALVLVLIGWRVADGLVAEIEARADREQRFILEVAAWPGFPITDETLVQIRDRAVAPGAAASKLPETQEQTELIVTQDGRLVAATLSGSRAHPLTVGLDKALAPHEGKPTAEGAPPMYSFRLDEDARQWRAMGTRRMTRGGPQRFYVLQPASEVTAAQSRAVQRLAWLGIAGLALAGALGLVLARWLAAPVASLARAAETIRSSGLDASPAPITKVAERTDEIGGLARAFMAMLESLRKSEAEQLHSARLAAVGRLATSVAHEIRNPLTSLRMTIQMLQDSQRNADARTQEAYRIVLGEIDRLALTVEELVTFARPRPAQRAPVQLEALLRDIHTLLSRQFAHANVVYEMGLSNIPPTLPLDASKLKQLLMNLLINAIQAMPRGGKICLRANWDAAAEKLYIEIEDTGTGVPKELAATLFEPFVSTKHGGGGLGLAIAKQIAEEHGGTITFSSEPGKTIFSTVVSGKS